jgi:DNA polymerase-3 subunit alpha
MTLVNNIDDILAFSQRLQRDSQAGQVGLFGDEEPAELAPKLKLTDEAADADISLMLAWERELLGLYLSHNPLEPYESILNNLTRAISSISRELDGRMITVGGCINQIREISTKSGSKMAFVTLADTTGEIEAVAFPKLFAQNNGIWQRDNFILAKGKVDFSRSEDPKLLIEEAEYISEEDAKNFKGGGDSPRLRDFSADSFSAKQRLYIRLEDSQNQPLLLTLKEKLDGHRGDTEVVLVTGESSQKQVIKLPQTISINEQSLRELAGLFGSTNVVIR